MSIKITQPFSFDSQKPNFERDVINSSLFESQSPLSLNSDESAEIGSKYDVGHIVWDINTRKHYRLEYTNSTYRFVAEEPIAKTTNQWYGMGNSYIPMLGEIIVFTDYRQVDGSYIPTIKIGDGVHSPSDLPFASTDYAANANYATTAGTAGKVEHPLHIGPHDYDGSAEVTIGTYDGSYSTT